MNIALAITIAFLHHKPNERENGMLKISLVLISYVWKCSLKNHSK